ncbi:hypothetical protein LN042_19715 [Kitasatospora sp. RB6PN24]|uniref:hypothetical protein n=1 Tax=Kitasatospora humi TaxID=2893891 RepID=UPI001E641FEB|nr:hypothetical protein [Kitasatospora humi]MCC9309286.1 hypothetical protein [Kitasatospora humi]
MSDDNNTSHEWVIAAWVPVDAQGAAYARRRGIYRVPATTKVTSAEVMCAHCRKPYDQALDTPCPATDPTLHGGPVGTRKRRTPENNDSPQTSAALDFRKPDPNDPANRMTTSLRRRPPTAGR